jgi:hypothetical protein
MGGRYTGKEDPKLAFTVKSRVVQKGAEEMESSHKYTKRLAQEHSPYLLQRAHNPVKFLRFSVILYLFNAFFSLSWEDSHLWACGKVE